MRRGLLMAGVWALGVVVAVALAFAAVDRVASGVSSHDNARLSQRAIDDELGRRFPDTNAAGSTTSRPRAPTATSTTTTTKRPTGSTTSTTTTTTRSTATTTTTSPGVSGSSMPTTGTFPGVTFPTTTSPDTATPQPPAHNTATTARGGTLFTHCSGPDRIDFVAAVPQSGYQRTVDDESPGGIRQSFVNGSHRSNIEAECSDGTVHAQVEEESEGD